MPADSHELELIEQLASFHSDPLGFVRWAFPWGEPGELARFKEPHPWQCAYLEELGDLVRSGRPALLATSSGHGIGKSALNGMETWWAFSTAEGTKGVVTANTENQLRTKTWVEMAKWHRLFIAKDFFKYTASALFSADEALEKEWRIDIVPWSERNTEAFAGLHNAGKRIIVLFDEASAIPDIIWETTEGILTDEGTEIIWSVKGNPTRNQGRFRSCFPGGRFAHRWSTREIDSRSVPGTNKVQIQEWLEDYGEDSDFFRVRVKGKFPRQDQNSFIPYDLAMEAAKRPLAEDPEEPWVMGVDVGRFGDDPSIINFRRGSDMRSRTPRVFQGLSTVQLADRVALEYQQLGGTVAAVFVDEGGVGGGVVDRLQMLGIPVIGVQFGGASDSPNPLEPQTKYANKRAEMWGALRFALRHLCIPMEIRGLTTSPVEELSSPLYDYQLKTEALVIESKKSLKARGVPSPNWADAAALTFAYPALAQGVSTVVRPPKNDYNPYAQESLNGL
jgi:hypothetical protein